MASGNPQSELSSDLVKYEGSVYSGSDAAALEAQKPEAPSREEEPRDPDLVDWDGPDDPENPYNWSGITKALQLTILAFNSFLTYVLQPVHGIVIVIVSILTKQTMLDLLPRRCSPRLLER